MRAKIAITANTAPKKAERAASVNDDDLRRAASEVLGNYRQQFEESRLEFPAKIAPLMLCGCEVRPLFVHS
jgi:hypothetical protein